MVLVSDARDIRHLTLLTDTKTAPELQDTDESDDEENGHAHDNLLSAMSQYTGKVRL